MNKKISDKYPQIKELSDAERVGMVKEIFSTITNRYDFLNHLLSLRRDIAWRRFAIKKMDFSRGNALLDVACGTGDLSIGAALYHPSIVVSGIDLVPQMMEVGKKKVLQKGLADRVNLSQGDALQLSYADNSFAVTAMAFGIRNIPDRVQALKEMVRVTAPGGKIMILEMTFIQNRLFKVLYYIYLNFLLPLIAKLFSKNAAAYYYLADSIMNFPTPAAFAWLMEDAGMKNVKKYPLTFGITWLYIGEKAEG
jgi:demethylmenaquinone methyltransferase / 2-methoxy-6-polyprenyl-1,4-benzoquinol methylase